MEQVLQFIYDNREIITIVILSIFLGIEVIGSVPSVLHTPLMSGANAIHGVVIIGAIIVMGKAEPDNYIALVLGFFAVILGTLNVVGGFVVTDRMLEMFKKKKKTN
jgi:NAD(P) transhydrogenase subunit alpha